MTRPPTLDTLVKRLDELAAGDLDRVVFGSWGHQYQRRPLVDVPVIDTFEAEHRLRLPDDYRAWITEVSDGGPGPGYGLLPLESLRAWDGWTETRSATGRPCPHVEAWCNLDPPTWRAPASLFDGCIRLAHLGCGYYDLLVVNGPRAGEVWTDWVAVSGGGKFEPKAPSFTAWMAAWLDRELVTWAMHELRMQVRYPERPVRLSEARLFELTGTSAEKLRDEWLRRGYRALHRGDLASAEEALEAARATWSEASRPRENRELAFACDILRARGDDLALVALARRGADKTRGSKRGEFLRVLAGAHARLDAPDAATDAWLERAVAAPSTASLRDALAALSERGRLAEIPALTPRLAERRGLSRAKDRAARVRDVTAQIQAALTALRQG